MINSYEYQKVNFKDYKRITGVSVSTHMSGKMLNIPGISTSNLINPFCIARKRDKNSICSKCFADKTLSRYSALRVNCENNFKILTKQHLKYIPDFDGYNTTNDSDKGRFESFGDLYNVLQYRNYYNIAKYNELTHFALWTKNPEIIRRAINKYGLKKLDNLQLVCSVSGINSLDEIDTIERKYGDIFDYIFIVVTQTFADANGIKINCGARDCNKTCGACYYRGNGRIRYEILK